MVGKAIRGESNRARWLLNIPREFRHRRNLDATGLRQGPATNNRQLRRQDRPNSAVGAPPRRSVAPGFRRVVGRSGLIPIADPLLEFGHTQAERAHHARQSRTEQKQNDHRENDQLWCAQGHDTTSFTSGKTGGRCRTSFASSSVTVPRTAVRGRFPDPEAVLDAATHARFHSDCPVIHQIKERTSFIVTPRAGKSIKTRSPFAFCSATIETALLSLTSERPDERSTTLYSCDRSHSLDIILTTPFSRFFRHASCRNLLPGKSLPLRMSFRRDRQILPVFKLRSILRGWASDAPPAGSREVRTEDRRNRVRRRMTP